MEYKVNTQIPSYSVIDEPYLSFDPENANAKHRHPLKGLLEFGPYSGVFPIDPVRVGAIFPYGNGNAIASLVRELESKATPRERLAYLVEYPGFSKVFGLKCLASDRALIELPKDLDSRLLGRKAHLVLAEELARSIANLNLVRNEFDVLFLYLPEKWSEFFSYKDESEDFDLHDYLKAITASQGIPIQIVREGSALKYFCRASVMWRMSIAVFCKAGGIPWKLQGNDDLGFVGISYAIKNSGNGTTQFVTCCSQVFDADGGGLEFLAYDTKDKGVDPKNPFLSRIEMRSVMARTMRLYQKRHGGVLPQKLIIHKNNEFTADEIDGCFDAWGRSSGLELLQIKQNSPWRGVEFTVPRENEKPKPMMYPAKRGTYLHLDGYEILLWTQGDAASVVEGGKHYFKEGKGIPKPIALKRFAGHGGWHLNAESILGLTKMNWNNDSLYGRLPVTLEYASTLAKTIKRMSNLSPRPYQFRFFM